ncbi:MAG: lipoyl(octanoyl) transferase LipB [Chloroflexota bacterium]
MALPQSCVVYDLGTVAYPRAVELQQALERARREGRVPDVLLLLEHPPVLTLGRSGGIGDILAPAEALAAEGITVFVTDRGGGVTYHGPGQLVAYPILDLPRRGLTVTGYVRLLEQTVIHLLAGFGIAAGRLPGYPGVWVDGEKVCALGVHISHGITRHGLALNVDPDLRHFNLIRPCGISDRRVTSVARLLGRPVAVTEVKGTFRESFRRTLGIPLVAGSAKEIESILRLVAGGVQRGFPPL